MHKWIDKYYNSLYKYIYIYIVNGWAEIRVTITAFQNGFRHVRPGRSVDKLGDQGGMARAAKVIRKLKNQLELELELFHIFRFHSFRCLAIRSIGSIGSILSIGSIGCGELLSRALEFSAAFCLWPGISARTSSAGAMVGLWLWGRIRHDFANEKYRSCRV